MRIRVPAVLVTLVVVTLVTLASLACGRPLGPATPPSRDLPPIELGEGEGEGEGEGDGEGEGEGAVPDDMVEVPAGAFAMGCDACGDDEGPARTVTLSRFLIDRTEVTQAAYQACVDDGACTTVDSPAFSPSTRAQHPMVAMTWDQAVAFCAHLDRRLPSEVEWEKAARGDDGRTFPWGDADADCTLANTAGCVGGDDDLPVGTLPAGASPYGALDMAGNVWEWTADFYAADAYSTSSSTDPAGPSQGTSRVYRGGGSGNTSDLATTTNRADTYSPGFGGTGLGFRCAR
jgi:formylglycine-generating enzyme required for sulfatase activity